MLNEPEKSELESIITLSSTPMKDLTTVITHMNKQITFNEETPLIVKPFLKRDIPTITSYDEKEWLTLLTKIKGNFERINSSALKIFTKDLAEIPKRKKTKQLTKPTGKRPSKRIQITEKKMNEEDISTSYVPLDEEKKSKNGVVYCPECGHGCQGMKGLRVHIFQIHKQSREEMLQTIKLYNVQASRSSDVS
jgi:hypothetical protein